MVIDKVITSLDSWWGKSLPSR